MKRTVLLLAALSCPALLHAEAGEPRSASAAAAQTMSGPVLRATPTWTGFYAGVNIGGGTGNGNVYTSGQATANVNNVNGGARPATVALDRSGVLGGAQIGYDRQFGHFVLGGEADAAGSGIRGQRTVVTTALTGGASLNNSFSSELRYLGTARARVGYAFGRALLYGTGGFAYGSTDDSANFYGAQPANVLQFTSTHTGGVTTGYAAGGGGEYRMSRHVSLKAEYLHFHLEDEVLNVAVIAGSGGGGTGYNSQFENKGDIGRIGVNFRF